MSSRPRRRQQRQSSPRPPGHGPVAGHGPVTGAGPVSRIPRQRSADDDASTPRLTLVPSATSATASTGSPTTAPTSSEAPDQPPVLVADDAAMLVLHGETEDPDFQRAVDELAVVRMVGEYLEWVGEGVSPPADEDDEADAVAELEARLGIHHLSASGVGRHRAQAIAIACARMRLICTEGERLEPGPDRAGWTDPDPVLRTWLRSRVAAAVLECSVRILAGEHLLGDDVRHALATVVIAAGEGQPCVLGLRSATRPGDLAAEHVDRVVIEHVAELQALGLCAPGGFVAAAPGVEAVLRSVAVGLRNEPVPGPIC